MSHLGANRSEDHTRWEINRKLDELGSQLYGEQWPNVKVHNIRRLAGENGAVAADCTTEQLQTLLNGLRILKHKRQNLSPRG